jgi:cytochrome o ubiquinol oxidase subunit II
MAFAFTRVMHLCKRAALLVATFPLVACHSAVLDPHGPIGKAEKTILVDSLAIMLAIVVPTIIATLGIAWWFRASNKHALYLPTWEYSGQIELVVWAIPIMVITLLGGVTWIGAHKLDPAIPLESKSAPLDIQVVSLDWKWLFIYPSQKIATVNELVVPSNVPLHLTMTSSSVLNAFFIPQLGSMIYTMAGMTTELNLSADEVDTFRGLSSHYSGEGFSDMHFNVRAVSSDDFDAWILKVHSDGRALDSKAYSDLAKPSIGMAPTTYGAVDTGLFDKIVRLNISPGPGPSTEHAGATQSALEH